MTNLIRISNALSINDKFIDALYLTPGGELVAEIENNNPPDFSAVRFLTWEILNDICQRFTESEYGHPYRLIDILEQHGFMSFSDEPKLRMTIEKCTSAHKAMLHFGEEPVNNVVPLIPTLSEFCAIFADKAEADKDDVFELMMAIDDLRGVTIERTTGSAAVAFTIENKLFQAAVFAIEDGEAVIFFDTNPILYHLSPQETSPLRWYIDKLTEIFDATMDDSLIYVPVDKVLNNIYEFAMTIDSFIDRIR